MSVSLWPTTYDTHGATGTTLVSADVFRSRLLGGRAQAMGEPAPTQWREWLTTMFPQHFYHPLGQRHRDFWRWVLGIKREDSPLPFVGVWPRGSGKCYSGDVNILRADGTRTPIRDLRVGDRILSFNEVTGRVEPDAIAQHWHSGLKPCLAIRTRTGKRVEITAEHRLLTFDGWKVAGDVRLGDRIAAPRRTPVDASAARQDEEVRLLAYMIAEGSCSSGNSKFTNLDAVIVHDFRSCAAAMGFRVSDVKRGTYNLAGAKGWLRDVGLDGCTALTKRVPDWVFRLPVRQKWMFLAALVDTDGWVLVDRGQVCVALANEALIKDLTYLFLQVGVVTQTRHKPNGHAGAWELRVDQEGVPLCAEALPLRLKGAKLAAAATTRRYSLLDTYPPEIARDLPFGVSREIRNAGAGVRAGTPYQITRDKMRRLLDVHPHPLWAWLEQADVFWDAVVAIERVGVRDTYDVEVAHNHTLIGDGLVGHNSTSAEVGVVALGIRDRRRYALYVRETQEQADKSVENIAALLESSTVRRFYPEHGERKVGKFGNQRGWRRNRLRTAGGFTVDALGLDVASRGLKVEEQRPDLIVFDDIDGKLDSPGTTAKKRDTITHGIIPAGSGKVAILGIQNLIIPGGIFTQLADGTAEFLVDRILSGPFPAIEGLTYDWKRDERTKVRRAVITGGKATWEGQNLETCQRQIDRMGLSAFLRECQHNVKEKAEGIVLRFAADRHLEDLTDDEITEKLKGNEWRAFAGVDFGAWRFACILRAVDRQRRVHQLDEYFAQRLVGEASLRERARDIHEMVALYGLDPVNRMTPIYGDAANPTDILEINLAFRDGWDDVDDRGKPVHVTSKLRVIAVAQENKSRKTAVERMNNALDHDELFYRRGLEYDWRLNMNASSAGTEMHSSRMMHELENWSYATPRPGETQDQNPDDATADGADLIAADRYCLMSHWRPTKAPKEYGLYENDRAKPFDYTKAKFVEPPHAADELGILPGSSSTGRRRPVVRAPRPRIGGRAA